MTSFSIFSNWHVQTCLSIFRHYDLLHSEPFSSDMYSDSCAVMDFYFHVLLHAAYFWVFSWDKSWQCRKGLCQRQKPQKRWSTTAIYIQCVRSILRILCYEETSGKTMKDIVKDFNVQQKKRNDRLIVTKMMKLCTRKHPVQRKWCHNVRFM